MLDWIKEHPYLAGGLTLGLIVFYFVYRSVAASSGTATQTVAYGGAPSDAVQTAQLAAGVAGQQTQAAADAQSQSLQAQLAALQLQTGGQVQIAQLQQQAALQNTLTSGQVASQQSSDQLTAALAATGGASHIADVNAMAATQINSGNNATSIALAGIQAPLSMAQIQASLQAQINQNGAAVSIAQAGDTAQVMIAGGADATQVAVAQANATAATAIAGGADATQVALGADQANVYNNLINNTTQVQLAGLGLVGSGVLNKGGEGGVNQVSAFGTIYGNPSAGFAPAQVGITQASGGNSTSSIISALFGGATKAIPAVAKAV